MGVEGHCARFVGYSENRWRSGDWGRWTTRCSEDGSGSADGVPKGFRADYRASRSRTTVEEMFSRHELKVGRVVKRGGLGEEGSAGRSWDAR